MQSQYELNELLDTIESSGILYHQHDLCICPNCKLKVVILITSLEAFFIFYWFTKMLIFNDRI